MKILKFYILFILLKSMISFRLNTEEETEEDEEIVYGNPNAEFSSKKQHPIEEVKSRMDNIKSNMINLGYDFSKAINILYSNYSNIDVRVSDIDYLFKKGIINENQAIMIWENLLNAKTERNLEWLGYNKIIKTQKENQQNKFIQNVITLLYNPEMKILSSFTYVGGLIFFYLMKFLLKFPKLNILMIFFLMLSNIIITFYFYNNKCYFTSSVTLCSFILNVYYMYLSLVVLSGNKDVDYSILHSTHFKSKEHFLVKTGICAFIIFLLNYLVSISLRYFLNYLLIFYFLEKNRDMIKNYFKLNTPKSLQPFESFVSLIFGAAVLLYTHIFYYVNIYYSYDLNSFLILNNFITFYYLSALEKFIFIQRTRLGGIYLDCEKLSDTRDKYELFEELKKKSNLEKNFRNENFYEGNIIDIVLMFFCILFLFLGFYFNTYFYLLIAIFILHTIHKNCLIFLSIKISRIVSSFFLLLFLIVISNLDQLNFSYINEIIAVYDQKFLEALLLLFKLLFLVSLAICNYLSEDFVDMFNIYNYTAYKYLSKETKGISNNNEITQKLNKTYKMNNVLKEIFLFDLNKALDYVNTVLDSIDSSSGSNIDAFYIDYLLTRNTSNLYLIPLLVDYFLIYTNIWFLFFTFRYNNHSFFYVTFLLHKIGIFGKLFLLIFEYSKTQLQKNLIIFLNIIFSMRLFNHPEIEEHEKGFLFFFFCLNKFFYFFISDNHMIMTFFILLFDWVMLNVAPSTLPYVAISVGFLFAKNLTHYLKLQYFKVIIYLVCAINSYFFLCSLNQKFLADAYFQFKMFFIVYFKFDLPSFIENLSFCHYMGGRLEDKLGKFVENSMINKLKDLLLLVKNFSF